MALLLDSAIASEAQTALQWGWVKGITTNPTILAQSDLPPAETLAKLAAMQPGELYYQLTTTDFDLMVSEGYKAREIIGKQTVLKVPATPVGFQVVSHLAPTIDCAVTAIYHPAQAAVAAESGAKYAIAYVNRATRLLGDGLQLVRDMAAILEPSDTEILAASIKSADEAAGALQAGAQHLTLPLAMLEAITTHELSEQTVAEFAVKGCGLV
jgi:transaldolase